MKHNKHLCTISLISVPNDMTPLFAVSAITQAQELTSPDFPLNYPPDFHASWIINTLYSNQQVILHVSITKKRSHFLQMLIHGHR